MQLSVHGRVKWKQAVANIDPTVEWEEMHRKKEDSKETTEKGTQKKAKVETGRIVHRGQQGDGG